MHLFQCVCICASHLFPITLAWNDTNAAAISFVWATYLNTILAGELVSYAMFAAQMTDKFGRLPVIRLSLTGGFLGNILHAVSSYPRFWWLLFFGRFFVGISYGLFCVSAPTFLTETSPPNVRGRMIVVLFSGSAFGAVLGSVLGMEKVLGE